MKKLRKRKSIITYILPLLVLLVAGIGITGVIKTNKNLNKNSIAGADALSKQEDALLNIDDENLLSTKYLVTDTTIENIKEDTTIEELKKGLNKEIKVYYDSTIEKEIIDGNIVTGMVAEDKNNNIYNLIVAGDINKDGKVNQIDITKIIRNEIKDEYQVAASKFGKDKIAEKIVYGKYDLGDIKEVKSPEIQIVSGKKGENNNYTSDVEIKIKQQDEEGIKTVYKISGSQEKQATLITSDESINLTQDGVYKLVSYTYGKYGNRSKISTMIIKINKTGIIPTITYSTQEVIEGNVTATVIFNKDGITITNNNGKNTYEFTENGSYTFEYKDEAGRTGSITAEVTWIRQPEKLGQDGEWKYFVRKDGKIQLTQYMGNKTEITVPAMYNGYEVYSIGYQGATSEKSERYNVFGENLLSNTKITKVTIENGIKEIGIASFSGCSSISNEIYIPNTVEAIKDAAFNGCTKISGALNIPDSVKSIGSGAFQKCSSLKGTLTLSNSLEYIGDAAFNGCTQISGILNIPNSVRSIGTGTFQNCINLNGALILSDNLESIPDYAFNGCKNLTGKLKLPEGITSIGKTAFQNCISLTGEIKIPGNVTKIGDYAFNKCTGFDGNLTIPTSVKDIGGYVFGGCNKLNGDLIIPDSVTNLGIGAFQNCSGFAGNLYISSNLDNINAYTFNYCSKLKGSVVIPNGVTSIGYGAFNECNLLNGSITLPNTLTSIEDFSFNHCENITGNLVIPSKVERIGDQAFNACGKLTGDLTIPDSVKYIGFAAFQDCSNFNGILTISKNAEYIGDAAFNKLTNIKNNTVSIPATLSKMGDEYSLNGSSIGVGNHFFYNFGANVGNFVSFEIDDNNTHFKVLDGVLYTKDGKRLVSYPRNKKDKTYEILEGVEVLDQMSIASNMTLETLIIPDSLSMELRTYPGFTWENDNPLNFALYSYTAIENIQTKDTNTNYMSVDGVLYTKDLTQLVYVSSGRKKEVIIPEGVTTIKDKAFYYSQVARKISKLSIPSSLINLSDETISLINGVTSSIEVSNDNPAFRVDANNKLIKK